jgi:hypothetical protein
MCGSVRTIAVIAGIDDMGVKAGGDGRVFDDCGEVKRGSHESVVDEQVATAAVITLG